MSYVNNWSQNNKCLEGVSGEEPSNLTLERKLRHPTPLEIFCMPLVLWIKEVPPNNIYIRTHHLGFWKVSDKDYGSRNKQNLQEKNRAECHSVPWLWLTNVRVSFRVPSFLLVESAAVCDHWGQVSLPMLCAHGCHTCTRTAAGTLPAVSRTHCTLWAYSAFSFKNPNIPGNLQRHCSDWQMLGPVGSGYSVWWEITQLNELFVVANSSTLLYLQLLYPLPLTNSSWSHLPAVRSVCSFSGLFMHNCNPTETGCFTKDIKCDQQSPLV